MHILITGGAGFIGSHLVEHHLKKGDQVYVVDNLSTGSQENLDLFVSNQHFQYEVANVLTWPQLNEAALWADRVYHLAAVVGMYRVLEDPVAVLATNIAGCERVLRAVAASKWPLKTLIASSSEVYGASAKQPLQEDDLLVFKSAAHRRWGYSISKFADEALALAYAKKTGLVISIVRLFNTIGPRQTGRYGMVVPRFIRQAFTGEPITIYGDGKQTRSFCDVRDLVVMLDLLLSQDASAQTIVNVGQDQEISIHQLALLIKKITKSHSPLQYISYHEAYGEGFDDVLRRKPSLIKLQDLISYSYRWNLEDTIRSLVAEQSSTS